MKGTCVFCLSEWVDLATRVDGNGICIECAELREELDGGFFTYYAGW